MALKDDAVSRFRNKPLRVDLHTHIIPKRLPNLADKYGYGGWISLQSLPDGRARMMLDGKPFRDIECNCWDAEERITDCKETGVDVQVISTIPVLFNYWAQPEHCLDLAKYLNDHIAQTCALYPQKFVGLATLPMQSPKLAVQELRRCVEELNLPGIQIGSHINEWNLDSPELEPVWTACEELDVAVFVHPWDMDNKGRMAKYWFPWLIGMPCESTIAISSLIFGGVLERHPKLRVCLAHGGGSFPYTLGRLEHGFNCRPDLVATNCKKNPMSYLGRIWCDSLVHDQDALTFLVKKMGIDRVMLGSDYPFPLGEQSPGKLVAESTDLSEEDKEKILGLNALKFLGLDRSASNFFEADARKW
ncbi:hypothetical protein BDK51DRAFT_35815 [Blyttiomyces helicus]|uniref:2-amino-3-carboxymuconate-6-semialdehyde decarboxylase n=1 Tax=Blyttiomyces helicus TaxID=388810 RepID=A0A4P9WPQ7_9FUNG|nr:hypothetical protein BDK51DRAFT_35815 [Blyttiomyces helicus]|eukprot:RKO94315.1 hypothetical protein BDK51DRAFT_35815 [Blyttiomyces helicus]